MDNEKVLPVAKGDKGVDLFPQRSIFVLEIQIITISLSRVWKERIFLILHPSIIVLHM
ncbi:MAG TPA: hypothetical protein PLI62_18775 [Spirochaetota bacterium]|nr:hypothetical protein [Spirochaetota bacterium]